MTEPGKPNALFTWTFTLNPYDPFNILLTHPESAIAGVKHMNKKPATLMLEDMTVSVPDSVLFQKVDDEIVLLNIASGEYYGLNEIGARVWTLLREGRSTHEVLDALLKEYDVSTERLSADIQQFLLALQSRGLVEVVADPKV